MEGGADSSAGEEATRLTEPREERGARWPAMLGAVLSLALTLAFVYFSLEPGVTLFSFHPIAMSVTWLILMTSGLNAFSPAEFALQWLPMKNRTTRHWILQVSAITCLTTGFIIIFIVKHQNGKSHYATLHGIFGLITFLLAYMTASGGLFTLFSLKFKKFVAPVYVKLLHSGVGILTYVSGIATILIILFSKWWKWEEVGRVMFAALIVIHMVWTIIRPTIKLYNRVRERMDYIRATN